MYVAKVGERKTRGVYTLAMVARDSSRRLGYVYRMK